jgi:hypothetical protein
MIIDVGEVGDAVGVASPFVGLLVHRFTH